MNKTTMNELNLDALKQAEFKMAKDWYFWVNASNLAIIFLGLVANLWPTSTPSVTLISAVLLAFSLFGQWISDSAKNNGEWLLRQFEMWDGMGWTIDTKALCNLMSDIPASVRSKIESVSSNKYFDSKKKKSPQRVSDNIRQSAFYSKCQARFISKVILAVGLGILLATFFMMMVAFQNLSSLDGNVAAHILLAIFQIVVGTGYIRTTLDYWQFVAAAGQIEDSAEVLAKDKTTSDTDAIRIAHDYQIARSSLPLIPEWVWKVKQDEINDLWMKLRNGN